MSGFLSLWRVGVNADSQAQPPRALGLIGSGLGPRNVHFSNSGDSSMCVSKARLEKAQHGGLVGCFNLLSLSFQRRHIFIKNVSAASPSW